MGGTAAATHNALQRVSLTIGDGDRIGVVGVSGSGKSTLLMVLLGLLAPTDGEVRVRGAPLRGLGRTGWRQMRRDIQFVPQDPGSSLQPRATVCAQIAEPLVRLHGWRARSTKVRAQVEATMDLTGLEPALGTRTTEQLSGGQAQRLALARALVTGPKRGCQVFCVSGVGHIGFYRWLLMRSG